MKNVVGGDIELSERQWSISHLRSGSTDTTVYLILEGVENDKRVLKAAYIGPEDENVDLTKAVNAKLYFQDIDRAWLEKKFMGTPYYYQSYTIDINEKRQIIHSIKAQQSELMGIQRQHVSKTTFFNGTISSAKDSQSETVRTFAGIKIYDNSSWAMTILKDILGSRYQNGHGTIFDASHIHYPEVNTTSSSKSNPWCRCM